MCIRDRYKRDKMDFFNSKKFRIFLLIILDICSVAAGAMGALILRFDASSIPQHYFWGAVHSMPVYFVITIAVMAALKLYNRVWTYASLNELFTIIKASVLIEAIFVCYHVLMQINMPRSYYPIGFLIMTILFMATRFAKAILKNAQDSNTKVKVTNRVMVIGAGSAAAILIKEYRARDNGTAVVCAIDDNKNKKLSLIHI